MVLEKLDVRYVIEPVSITYLRTFLLQVISNWIYVIQKYELWLIFIKI